MQRIDVATGQGVLGKRDRAESESPRAADSPRFPVAGIIVSPRPTPTLKERELIFRPLDRSDLLARLTTFQPLLWFAKPECCSAVECAIRGWQVGERERPCRMQVEGDTPSHEGGSQGRPLVRLLRRQADIPLLGPIRASRTSGAAVLRAARLETCVALPLAEACMPEEPADEPQAGRRGGEAGCPGALREARAASVSCGQVWGSDVLILITLSE